MAIATIVFRGSSNIFRNNLVDFLKSPGDRDLTNPDKGGSLQFFL